MPNTNIGWSESAPTDNDNLGLGAGEIRSLKTAIRNALDAEHTFPSSSGAAGAHKLGSARVYVGAASAVSSDGTDGRLMFNSTDSSLWALGASTVGLLGHPGILVNGNASTGTFASKLTTYMSVQFGTNRTGTGGAVSTHTFAGSGFSGKPVLLVTPLDADSSGAGFGTVIRVLVINPTFFQVVAEDTQSVNQSNITFNWISIGTVSSGVV